MTTDNHPITPPPELVQQWDNDWHRSKIKYDALSTFVATQAARWGADQEVGACCQWLSLQGYDLVAAKFRAARRPKPPSLKELALESVKRFEDSGEFFSDQMRELEFIRKALEQLDD